MWGQPISEDRIQQIVILATYKKNRLGLPTLSEKQILPILALATIKKALSRDMFVLLLTELNVPIITPLELEIWNVDRNFSPWVQYKLQNKYFKTVWFFQSFVHIMIFLFPQLGFGSYNTFWTWRALVCVWHIEINKHFTYSQKQKQNNNNYLNNSIYVYNKYT